MDDVRKARLERLEQRSSGYQAAEASTSSASPSLASRSEGDKYGPLPAKCLQRLMREMKQVEEKRAQHLNDSGISVSLADPQGENLRLWSLTILTDRIDKDVELSKQLLEKGAR